MLVKLQKQYQKIKIGFTKTQKGAQQSCAPFYSVIR
jgi:hypothetical protein